MTNARRLSAHSSSLTVQESATVPQPTVAGHRSSDRSGRYLTTAVIFLIVALIGAVLLVATQHDLIGVGLLLFGDAMMITVLVVYLFANPG